MEAKDWVELALKYVSWPVAMVVVLVLLRPPLTRFIDRLRIARAWGARVEADLPPQALARENLLEQPEATTALAVPEATPPLPEAKVTADSAARRYLENPTPAVAWVEQGLREMPMLKDAADSEERQRVLLRLLASSRVSFSFERTYRLIFGSQIAALQYLAGHPEGVSENTLKTFHEQTRLVPELTDYAFDPWLAFLRDSGLVLNPPDGRIVLSFVGRDFLKHLLDMGYSLTKAG